MVEQTQQHISALGVRKLVHLATDQRHAESSIYAFMDYDILGRIWHMPIDEATSQRISY